ncbi:MAG: DUF4194 domain-containing protein [Giesbergeria sp.]|uniref:DUF4194 domain-containing protein n=1 Tax=Giesbergeria sp. TaxID=2818473 RepID=UPI00260EB9EC|nr:DUF4194 domain-containing protein [Giesbergeria sp.]MDD2609020.1 DUF4194 domain-containing protein [Giesbergeria sp.]
MPRKNATPDIFDQWAGAAPAPAPQQPDAADAAQAAPSTEPTPANTELAHATPLALRRAVQELLKNGLLEQSAKPQLFRQIANDTARINAQLEPFDLQVRVDDVRGLAFVLVAPDYYGEAEDEDEWTHPLVRRQRLTLEQSLLLAILRREFLQREQESGLGVPVQLAVDGLLPQLEIYLGATGSDMQERKRLGTLLESLRGHGVVSEVDAQESITIRPMIVHLANPQNLQALLQHLQALAQGDTAAASPQSSAP